jgi:hypothetical protein
MLNKQKYHFSKNRGQKGKIHSGGWYHWEEGGYKERV